MWWAGEVMYSGEYALGVRLVSWIVSWISSLSSSSLYLIPFMLTCSMMRFRSPLLLGMCPCVVSVVMWWSLVCMWGCRGTLCGCGGCCVCDACTAVYVHVWMLRDCDCARLTAMLVWGMGEVCLWWVQGMWVVHVVQVLCLAQVTCCGRVWCLRWEELVDYVRYVCVRLGTAWVERGVSGWEDWSWALLILCEQGECWTCVNVLAAVVWVGSGEGSWTIVWSSGVVLCMCAL